MKQFIKFVFKFTENCKPLLLKMFPIELLRKIKKSFVRLGTRSLGQYTADCFSSSTGQPGVNLVANIKGDTGLSQSSRILASVLSSSKYNYSIYHYQQVSAINHSDGSFIKHIRMDFPYHINLVHINPHELPIAYATLPKKLWENRYNIAYWLWELEEFPEEWIPMLKLFHEVWTPSEFVTKSIRHRTDIPVHTIPYFIEAPTAPERDRSCFGLPESCFLFLCMYDCNSISERKNPLGAINAFKRAFQHTSSSVGLVIKLNHAQDEELCFLRTMLQGYSNIFFLTDSMSKVAVNNLIACCDSFVSLHRAEGFGLVLAEAMWLGKPVVCTNWSANTEFAVPQACCPVDYRLIPLENDIGPYKKGQLWADPNEFQAAQYMSRLALDKTYYHTIATNAQQSVRQQLSLSNAVAKLEQRIEEIYEQYP